MAYRPPHGGGGNSESSGPAMVLIGAAVRITCVNAIAMAGAVTRIRAGHMVDSFIWGHGCRCGCRRSAPKAARGQNFFQYAGAVGHYAVHAEIEQAIHFRRLIDGPDMDLQTVTLRG